MYWTIQLATQLDDAPWPASKEELIDYAIRSCLSEEVVENLNELEDEGEEYERMTDIWPEYAEWQDRIREADDESEF